MKQIFNTELLLEKGQFLNVGYFRGVLVYKPAIVKFKNRFDNDVEYAKIAVFETSKNENTGWITRTTFIGDVFAKNALETIKSIETQCVLKIEYTLCNKKVGTYSTIAINVLRVEVEKDFKEELLENEKIN